MVAASRTYTLKCPRLFLFFPARTVNRLVHRHGLLVKVPDVFAMCQQSLRWHVEEVYEMLFF